MVLRALAGALGLLSRLPVGRSEAAWNAARRTPLAFALAGYPIGALVGLPFLLTGVPLTAILGLGVPTSTAAIAYVGCCYLLTGITHIDGLADLADGAAIHGTSAERLDVMADPQTGVAGTLAIVLAVVSLALGANALAGTGSTVAFAVVLCAEVSAKTGMALLVCFGSAAHEGLGSRFSSQSDWRSFVPTASAAAPVLLLAPRLGGPAMLAAFLAGPLVALWLLAWSNRRLGGISGDVLGAANELGRVLAVHLGVIAWTLF